MRRLVLLLALVPFLTGCFYLPLLGGGSSSGSGEASAQSNVRNSVPAIEAWYADHDTYAGMTVALLQQQYDPEIKNVTLVPPLNRETYCVESVTGLTSYFKEGPAAEILEGHCGDRVVQAPPPPAISFDAQTNVRAAIPGIEAWNADHGTYVGMTIAKIRGRYDAGIPEGVKIVRATKSAYCVESTVGGETFSFRGPHGPLAPGAC
jgi:hypothetical protein